MSIEHESKPGEGPTTLHWMQRVMAATAVLLVLSTWKLWTPNTVFPQVPLFIGVGDLPVWIDWLLLGLMLVSLLIALRVGRTRRWARPALLVFAVAMGVSVAFNQHRLQPWAYQFIIMAAVIGLAPQQTLMLVRVLVVSIYVHSAISKLDYSFLHTHGRQLLDVVCQHVGLSIERWSQQTTLLMTALIPIAELVVGIALAFPRSRRCGIWGSLLLHTMLLLALGPWGLGHKPGVLIWNVYFMIQNILLFGFAGPRAADSEVRRTMPLSERVGAAVSALIVIAVVLLPLLEPIGRWDRWPAWAVYAAGGERYRVYIHEAARHRLPPELAEHVEAPRFDTEWCEANIGGWSLSQLNAPIYADARFQLGVAAAIARDYELGAQLTVIRESAADRMTGRRNSWEISGQSELRQEARRFSLNAWPRQLRQ